MKINDFEYNCSRLIECLHDGLIIVREGIIVEHNTCFEKISGYASTELIGSHIESLMSENQPQELQTSLSCYDNEEPVVQVFETAFIHKGGRQLDVKIRSIEIKHAGENACLWIIHDLSAQKKMEKELQNARHIESIAALSGGIAHDYNNLLTAIMGNISMALEYTEVNSRLNELLHSSLEASLLAKDLTKKLITFSKGGYPETKTTDIAPLLENTTEFTLSGSNVECEFSIPDNIWPVEVDASQISQAIHNVVINARESMPDGGLLQVTSENVSLSENSRDIEKGEYVKISIIDRGMGIPDEYATQIFDPYFSTKDRGEQKGMGLGLSICLSILKKHGGTITFESEYGSGSTFQIFLPASRQPVSSFEDKQHSIRLNDIKGSGKILIMDDEESVREVAGGMLASLGYKTIFAQNGEEAILIYTQAFESEQPFDAVILDLTIRGGLGGAQTIKKLIEINPKVKGIVSSGYSNDPVLSNPKTFGFRGVVAKPYSLQEMGKELARVLSEKTFSVEA